MDNNQTLIAKLTPYISLDHDTLTLGQVSLLNPFLSELIYYIMLYIKKNIERGIHAILKWRKTQMLQIINKLC